MKIFIVAGARPNFMKIAPIIRELKAQSLKLRDRGAPQAKAQSSKVKASNQLEYKLVHTGQHYDYEMSQAFFDDLEIPRPDYFLEAGSGSHAVQTAKIMMAFEKICEQERPDMVMVVGDVNSTLACSIVAKKLLVKVAHVEAGLRSFDLSMPEEINRMVTDSISDYFFVTEESGADNLRKEGKPGKSIHFVGHVMIDNLLYHIDKLRNDASAQFATADLKNELDKYVFLTLHRPSNVDDKETLDGIISALNKICREFPIIFPVHPRTRKMFEKFNVKLSKNVHLLEPLGFKESLFLWKDAVMVMTDSGGLQEETTALGVPCLTLRENTERPVTVEIGTNTLAGNRKESILKCWGEVIKNRKVWTVPPLWDGKAAERIVNVLTSEIELKN